jgi:hypothetical protein
MEMVVAPNINVIRRGILIGFATKLGSKLSGVSTIRNLSQSSAPPIATTRVIGILQMVFTNLIMTTHVNRTLNRALTSFMVAGGCKSIDAMHPSGGY